MIRFTNPTVETLARAVIAAHGGDVNLKTVKAHRECGIMSENADENYQKFLLETAKQLEEDAKALRAIHAFNEMAKTLGTELVEED